MESNLINPVEDDNSSEDEKNNLLHEAELFLNEICDDQALNHFTEREKMNIESVKFQQNMIKYVQENKDNPEKIEDIWKEYDEIISNGLRDVDNVDRQRALKSEFFGIKTSIIGSSASINFFESQGFKVNYPSPEEDMIEKCDLKFTREEDDATLVVQLKSLFLQDLSRKEIEEVVSSLILTDDKGLRKKKDREDFNILCKYCESKTNKHIPLFVKMPVLQEQRIKGRRTEIVKVVSGSGEINRALQKSLEMRWEKCKNELGLTD